MVLAIFILSVTLVGVVLYFFHAMKKFHVEIQDTGDETLKKNTQVLDQARQKAIKMIDEANNKAMDIVNKANLSTDIASANFNQELIRITSMQAKEFEKISSDFIKFYGQYLTDLKSKNMEVFQNISKNIERSTTEEIRNFKDSIEKTTVSSQDMVKKKIDAEYETIQTEINNYKDRELKRIEDEIFTLLEKISKLTLGKAINLSDHEDLILKSLEKAKKEGVFRE